jgi:hypothetical protein
MGQGAKPEGVAEALPCRLMTMWPVSPDLNSPKNDRPDLLDPIEEPQGDGEPVKRADDGDADREPTNSD